MTLDKKEQCKFTDSLMNQLKCRTNKPLIPVICKILNKGYERQCASIPSDPCDGITCNANETCDNGTCVSTCNPSGSSCSNPDSCCSGVCEFGQCN